ncbi:Uma2 family endonuclease [Methylomonas sp. SURF-1]|uniref:Uma2 family endonuclease n=1 Tax=Methylomonas aurea TaxID=2952224 RepID=A0ABT1UI39_9GAMM|nr:Uma2 family endonuclease [Methylomonas sp. SURF-1]MCQ8181904.1 Uma2 family endonuclease [Methylomonas sp. SURF-1]
MAVAEKLKLSCAEYLQGEETATVKHEYLDGEVWAMVGASDAHVSIAMNLAFLLKQALKQSPCRTYISDMKVNVAAANAFFYPDVLVSCNPKDRDNRLFKQHPVFIAEVLSPATEAFDRGAKFAAYRQLDSLQSYWLIDSRTQAIDCFRRTADNAWLLHSHTGPCDKLAIPELNLVLDFAEIYADVALDSEPPLTAPLG